MAVAGRKYRRTGAKNMKDKTVTGHLAALFTAVVWGTTFISTKILLKSFNPVEILFIRFIMGYLALGIACPKRIPTGGWKEELTFAGAGLCGITLYYLTENLALTYTLASNVGVVVSAAPLFTAVLIHFVAKEERFGPGFLAGFAVSMAGICLISFNGARLELNPLGDLLSVAAAILWACYSVITRKIGESGYSTIMVTRRIFFYGILFLIPTLPVFDCRLGPGRFADPVCLFNLVFLGLCASALCFVTWNYAVRVLGAIRTSVYIYMVPVVTVVTSVLVLREKITVMAAAGTVLTLAGLVISEWKHNQ